MATAQDRLRESHRTIVLCAELSKFAYTSANPAHKVSQNDEVAARKIRKLINAVESKMDMVQAKATASVSDSDYDSAYGTRSASLGSNSSTTAREAIRDEPFDRLRFRRFASKSGNQKYESERRWFRSQSYFYSYFDEIHQENRIVVAFRGTWLDPGQAKKWYQDKDGTSIDTVSWIRNWFQQNFPPSNKSLADLYYDATIMRTPYTDWKAGPVWKWHAIWGGLALEQSRWWPSWLWESRRKATRKAAAEWIGKPNCPSRASNTSNGDVHLGFWSLWASHHGFAGYMNGSARPAGGRKWDPNQPDDPGEWTGQPPKTDPAFWDGPDLVDPEDEPRMIRMVEYALKHPKEGAKTRILVIGHSLGGAVSSFAALDLLQRFGSDEHVTVTHVSFGSPPVGTAAFRKYFNGHFAPSTRHESWAVFHERDLVASCFGKLASFNLLLGRLGWWKDWSKVGSRVRITGELARLAAQRRSSLTPMWNAVEWLKSSPTHLLNGIFWTLTLAGVGLVVTVLGIGAALSLPVSFARSFPAKPWEKFPEPSEGWGNRPKQVDALEQDAEYDVAHHSLAGYIEHVERPDFMDTVVVLDE